MSKTLNSKGSSPTATADPRLASAVSAAASSGIRRFEPADGLFLRAEHLAQIEDYAAELSRINGLSGGAGVVYGFTLDLDATRETVGATAGLALDPSGRALRSRERLQVDLSLLERGVTNRIWIVEIVAAEPIPVGNEPLYSAVCSAPCGPESAIQPWLDDAVQLRVRAESLPGDWVDQTADRMLSALVSAYFERERRGGGPWFTPAADGAPVPDVTTWPWATAAPPAAPGPAGVPLGVLARIGDRWYLDVWGARRDRIRTPPDAAWTTHLSRRPGPVFTAQVLQFQDHLARGPFDRQHPLTDRFVELPPAGFLPLPADIVGDGLPSWLDDVFGGSLGIEATPCSADVALSAVDLAQHLDRIPLRGPGERIRPAVQVLVPAVPADLPAVATPQYGWLAFVRRPRLGRGSSPVTPAAPQAASSGLAEPEPVGVHLVDAPRTLSRYQAAVERAAAEAPIARVVFDPGWALERQDQAAESIQHAMTAEPAAELWDVVATSADADRGPLVAARARALVTALGLPEARTMTGVFPAVLDGPDAIFLMIRRRR
jgi:hypothetical protein